MKYLFNIFLCLLNPINLSRHKMGYWIWVASYAMIASAIMAYNDDFRMEALEGFTAKFKILVEELAMYLKPMNYPYDLVTRLCMEKLQK